MIYLSHNGPMNINILKKMVTCLDHDVLIKGEYNWTPRYLRHNVHTMFNRGGIHPDATHFIPERLIFFGIQKSITWSNKRILINTLIISTFWMYDRYYTDDACCFVSNTE